VSDRDHRAAAAKHAERAHRLELVPPLDPPEPALTPEETASALSRIASHTTASRPVARVSGLRRRGREHRA